MVRLPHVVCTAQHTSSQSHYPSLPIHVDLPLHIGDILRSQPRRLDIPVTFWQEESKKEIGFEREQIVANQ